MPIATILGADTPAAPLSSDHRQRHTSQRDGRHTAVAVRPRSLLLVQAPDSRTALTPSSCASACVHFETMVSASNDLKFSLAVVACMCACM